MGTIRDLSAIAVKARIPQPGTTWRDDLLPANFDGFPFHVEQATIESGRRIVIHEFPKKERPYSEDMGHMAYLFSVRGYIIVYPHDDPGAATEGQAPTLYQRDYRKARDALQARLDKGGPGVLQLPTYKSNSSNPLVVVCQRYRLSEEERFGGYCTFDMQFVERGVRPFLEITDPADDLFEKTFELRKQVEASWAAQADNKQAQLMGPLNPLIRLNYKPTKMGRFIPTSQPSPESF